MTKKDLNNWIMYYEIQKLTRLGFKKARISRHLGINFRTVSKYLAMSEDQYEQLLLQNQQRAKVLSPYELFVKDKLSKYQDTSAAQIHDWLKEHHSGFPAVTPRTVYNFVMFIRQKYNIPYVKEVREYFPVKELPYGKQAQVDFGDYNMRTVGGTRKKVTFFAMVLSRSRMKFIWFLEKPFTADTVCQAHEYAFAFFEGIPIVIVYDQDRTMVVDENIGDVILTATFKQYIDSRSFKMHFCRKADPESKGKVENVVQYVKKNFLYNRPYYDIDTLNTEATAWLERTANHLPHNYTKKTPEIEIVIEKKHLNPYTPMTIENKEVKIHHVRKTNSIAYKSNFYTVPVGTYQGIDSKVEVKEKAGNLEIYNLKEELICTHQLATGKGKTVSNTNHKRDTSKSLDKMMAQVAEYFTDQKEVMSYLQQIREKTPRYTRDHLQAILKPLNDSESYRNEKPTADKTLEFCIKNRVLNGKEFEQVYHTYALELETSSKTKTPIKPFDISNSDKANEAPEKSNMEDYEKIINP
jgi:hypothetical protein